MESKLYYFYVRTGIYDKLEREQSHWRYSKRFSSKEALRKHFTCGGQTVKKADIYTAKQLIEEYKHNPNQLTRILKEAVRNSGTGDGAY